MWSKLLPTAETIELVGKVVRCHNVINPIPLFQVIRTNNPLINYYSGMSPVAQPL